MERFWSKVDKSGDCWVWLGSKTKGGYGKFRLDAAGHKVNAARHALALTGFDVEGKQVHHLCRNPSCVRPDHLELLSTADHGARHRKWTEERILAAFADFYRKVGACPSSTDWNPSLAARFGWEDVVERFYANEWPAANIVKARFTTWNAAVEAAGFIPRRVGERTRTARNLRNR